jgi:phosphoribosylformimino-5-aminoimidazole carboxamide ribotide isomerase
MPLTILPSIDLRAGRVVRLQQGDYDRQLNYDVDPVATARSFKSAGAEWLHVVDLDGAKEGRPVQAVLIGSIIRESHLRVEVGGGVREREHVEQFLAAGAERVVIGTRALEDWHWFEKLVTVPDFKKRIVLALDAKDGIVATRGWIESSGKRAVDIASWVSRWPLAAILYTDVAKDGMLTGPNYEQTRSLAEVGDVPVIASGGIGSIDHIRKLRELPVWGAIVGRSLYEGRVDLAEAIRVARGEV